MDCSFVIGYGEQWWSSRTVKPPRPFNETNWSIRDGNVLMDSVKIPQRRLITNDEYRNTCFMFGCEQLCMCVVYIVYGSQSVSTVDIFTEAMKSWLLNKPFSVAQQVKMIMNYFPMYANTIRFHFWSALLLFVQRNDSENMDSR